jgi:hypothetical protein
MLPVRSNFLPPPLHLTYTHSLLWKMYVGTKTRKFPLPVMDMPVHVLGSVCILAHARTGTEICIWRCVIIRIFFFFNHRFTYLPL